MRKIAQIFPAVMGKRSLNFPFSDTFTRSDGALGDPWVGGTWTISTNKAINTPVPSITELVVNGDFAAWTGDNPDGWTLDAETGGHYVEEDAGKCHYVCDAGQAFRLSQIILTEKTWYLGRVNITTVTSGRINVSSSSGTFQSFPLTTTGLKTFAGRTAATTFRFWSETQAANLVLDDISVKALTLAELFATIPTSATDYSASINVTTAQGLPSGLVLNLNSAAAPTNFVLCYISMEGAGGNFVILDKCVNGTYTQVQKSGITYGAGRTVNVVKSGTTYTVSYNGGALGTPQTISDATVIGNTTHGLFSLNAGSSLVNFVLA